MSRRPHSRLSAGSIISGAIRFGYASGFAFANAEAADLVAAMTVEPDNDRKLLIDTLVGAFKTASVWTKLGVLYVIAAHDAQAARLNWKSAGASANLSVVNSPTFTTDRGYTGNSAGDGYLSSGIAVTSIPGYSLNSAHLGIWILNNIADLNYMDIGGSANGRFRINTRTDGNALRTYLNSTATPTISGITTSAGLSVGVRVDASNVSAYKNSTKVYGPSTPSSSGTETGTFLVLKAETGTTSSRQAAVAFAGSALTDADVSAIHSALQSYLSAVGAV